MPTYIVSIRETVNLQVEVEAENEEAANAEAIEAVVQEGSDRYFLGTEDRSVYMTLEKKS
jgi:hypothetical protein